MPCGNAILNSISTYKSQEEKFISDKSCDYNAIKGKMKRVALFPYNKEMSSFVNYSSLLNFKIADIYTCKYLGNVGEKIESIYNDFSIITKSIEQIDFTAIDCIIIGHLSTLQTTSNINYKQIILEKCLASNTSVFSLDGYDLDPYVMLFEEKGLYLYAPNNKAQSLKKRKGKLFQVSTPVLGIFGTSSKQGKFTLQLQLRKLLLEHGYNISQLSSEPMGKLFGMDECFTFGFNSANNLNEYEFINEINGLMHKLDMMESELIIVGSQSGTVSEAYNHLGQITIKQLEFLIGTMPDGVILCVNPNDEINYIQRTISSIQSIISTKVIALAIFPFFFQNGWKFITNKATKVSKEDLEKLKKKYAQIFELEGFVIGDENDIKSLSIALPTTILECPLRGEV